MFLDSSRLLCHYIATIHSSINYGFQRVVKFLLVTGSCVVSPVVDVEGVSYGLL